MTNGFKFNKYGFTLPEVLITVVIIGIIAAIAIPVINSNISKKDLESRFLKVYSELNKFSEKFYLTEGISFTEYCYNTTMSAPVWLNEFMSYYNTSGYATMDSWSTQEENKDNNYRLYSINGANAGIHGYCDNTGFVSDITGALYKFNDAGPLYNGPVVCVDINGLKGPNRVGYDYFLFVFTKDNKVIPMGMYDRNNPPDGEKDTYGNPFSNECNKNSNSGWGCAYYALQNKHPQISSKKYWGDFI